MRTIRDSRRIRIASHFGARGVVRRGFTLIELMVSMFLVSVLAYFLIQALVVSQKAWDLSDSIARIYESSRVAFDLIEHDLKAMVTSTVDGAEIGVYVGDPDPDSDDANDCLQFTFVSSTEPADGSKSRLCEVSYKYHKDVGATNPDQKPYVLYRQQVSETDNANWNFLGMPNNWAQNSVTLASDFETVIRGVDSFEVRFYDTNDVQLNPGTDTFIRPGKVVFDMILFDEKLTGAPEAKWHQTKRSFTKVVYLNHVID